MTARRLGVALVLVAAAVVLWVRLLPLSVTLLLAAVGVPRLFPNASPRRVVQIGFLALFAGIVILVALLDIGAAPAIITWPMLLAGLAVGLIVSIFQAVTQIQEQTLTFIPKILALALVMVVLGPWMLNQILGYTTELWLAIPNLVSG